MGVGCDEESGVALESWLRKDIYWLDQYLGQVAGRPASWVS